MRKLTLVLVPEKVIRHHKREQAQNKVDQRVWQSDRDRDAHERQERLDSIKAEYARNEASQFHVRTAGIWSIRFKKFGREWAY